MQSPKHVDQVGGTHYAGAYQHWDFVLDNNINYLDGCASKYVLRWREKGGLQDLHKAISYLRKQLLRNQKLDGQLVDDPICGPEPRCRYVNIRLITLQRLYENYKPGEHEKAILTRIFSWETAADLRETIDLIRALIELEEGKAYVRQGAD